MKSFLCLLLSIVIVGGVGVQKICTQTTSENLLDKVDLNFYLEGEPAIEDVGFSNLKSSWNVEYQLYLSDWDELKKIGRCGVKEDEDSKEYCSDTINQKLDKRVKKLSTLLAKGKYTRKQLIDNANREISIPVNFTPQVIDIFNQATKIYEKNPVLVFFVKSSISTKNSTGAKLKKKFMTEGLHPLKFHLPNKTFDYWNISKLRFTLRIVKTADGALELRGGYTHFG